MTEEQWRIFVQFLNEFRAQQEKIVVIMEQLAERLP